MSERELIAIGFQPRGDGTLHSPGRVTLAPTGEFYRLTIALPSGEIFLKLLDRFPRPEAERSMARVCIVLLNTQCEEVPMK